MKKMVLGFLALILAVPALAAAPKLSFCTGAEGGYYADIGARIGNKIVAKTKGELNIINTGGSVENAELFKEGDCELAFLQADALVSMPMPPSIKVTDSHVETIFWIHGPQGLDDFGSFDQEGNRKRYAVAIVEGSGGEVTMKNFGRIDEDYKDIRVVSFDGWDEAAEAAAQGYTMVGSVRVEVAGLLYVGRAGFVNKDIIEDYSDMLTVGDVIDKDFVDVKDFNGNQLYTKCEIGEDGTSGLKTDNTIEDQETYCVRAQIAYNQDYHKQVEGPESKALKKAVNKAIASTVKAVRQ